MDGNKRRVKRFTGNTILPQDIIWDGKGDGKTYLKDGFYKFSLKLQFESGNHPVSLEQFIEVDRTPAVVKITPAYREFSPNGDGRRDVLRFRHVTTGHARDRITMRIVDSSGTEYLRKEFRKEAFPAAFSWKGLGRDGKPLPEGLYTYSIETVDKVGNRSRSEVAKIRLKTGLEKVSVRSGVSAISPGNKNAVSGAIFRAGVSGKTIKDIREYQLQIATRSGRVVKSFRSKKFLPVVKWDGRDDSGKKLPDGKYQYKLSVKYSFGDRPVSVKRYLVIDTKAPKIRVAVRDAIFSPNKDGRKETLAVNQKVSGDGQDRYTGVFYDGSNRAVRLSNGRVPFRLLWCGTARMTADGGCRRADTPLSFPVKMLPAIPLPARSPGSSLSGKFRLFVFLSGNRCSVPTGTGKMIPCVLTVR